MVPRILHYLHQKIYEDLDVGITKRNLILKPTAKGNKPRIVAIAVNNTGMIRILPASIAASLVLFRDLEVHL
jgi:cell division protein FtsL